MPKDTVNASAGVAAGDTAVNRLTVFAKCPCAHCCRVDDYTGALTCTNGTSGILCAVCKKGTGIDPITGFDEGDTRYHRTIDDLCVQCPAESLADYLLCSGQFREPETRLPFSDSDLRRLDEQRQFQHNQVGWFKNTEFK